jgi:hypothetical protein
VVQYRLMNSHHLKNRTAVVTGCNIAIDDSRPLA